jgi:hypothetical protein
MILRILLLAALAAFPTPSANPNDAHAPAAQTASAAPAASVPTFPNSACPIMGKPVSVKLFAETEKGRIYVCCKSCIKDILEDVETAYATAYPATKKVDNQICPVSGDPIREDAPRVVLQGFDFAVHASEHLPLARQQSQIVLAKLNDPKLVDLGNRTCPVSGTPVAPNAFVVLDGTIVRLSSAKLLDEVQKDPAAVLAKAKQLRAKEAGEPAKQPAK